MVIEEQQSILIRYTKGKNIMNIYPIAKMSILFFLMTSQAFILSLCFAAEKPEFEVGNDGMATDPTECFAIGILKQAPPKEIIFWNQKPLAEYVLRPSYFAGCSGLFSAKDKKSISTFIGKPVVLKGHYKFYPAYSLKNHNREVAFKEMQLAEIKVFEITESIPATINQNNDILSIEAPDKVSGKESEFVIKLRNPFNTQLKNGILDMSIGFGVFPKNLEIKNWEESLYPNPQGKRANISLSSKEAREIRFGLMKKENSTILEKSLSESPVKLNVTFIGYVEQQAGEAEVISAHLEVNYLERYTGLFEHTPNGKTYGAVLHASFGEIMMDKWYTEKYGDVSSFDKKEVKISGEISMGSPMHMTSLDSIEIIKKTE